MTNQGHGTHVSPPSFAPTSARPTVVRVLLAAMNPAGLVRTQLEPLSWPMALLVPGLVFSLFTLQAGFDLRGAGVINDRAVFPLILAGLFLGIGGISLLAVIIWGLTRRLGKGHPLSWVIKAFSLAYTPALVYMIFGLLARILFGWNTTVTFGLTGLIWALMPLFAVIREMVQRKTGLSLALTLLSAVLLLLGWIWLFLL